MLPAKPLQDQEKNFMKNTTRDNTNWAPILPSRLHKLIGYFVLYYVIEHRLRRQTGYIVAMLADVVPPWKGHTCYTLETTCDSTITK